MTASRANPKGERIREMAVARRKCNAPRKPSPIRPSPLTEEMLARFDSRSATYDRENRFFDQDFEELRAANYLVMPVPSKLGGAG